MSGFSTITNHPNVIHSTQCKIDVLVWRKQFMADATAVALAWTSHFEWQ